MNKKKYNISILNLNCGNISSIYNALKYIGVNPIITIDKEEIKSSDGVIVPGNGNFNHVMKFIKEKKLSDTIYNYVMVEKKPYLGICIGFQILFNSSTEDNVQSKGLSFLPGKLKIIENKLKIDNFSLPHIGWNTVTLKKNNCILNGLGNNLDFYFMHSYIVLDADYSFVTSTCEYGEKFISSVEKANISAIQFHPEKSHDKGINLLSNWVYKHVKN